MNLSPQMRHLSVILFIILATLSGFFLVQTMFESTNWREHSYRVKARFLDLNGLKVGSPVRIAGVKVGQIEYVSLDKESYDALTTLSIKHSIAIPSDSSLSVYSDGLLGSKYVHLSPGLSNTMLQDGDLVAKTSSGVIVEELVSKFIASFSGR